MYIKFDYILRLIHTEDSKLVPTMKAFRKVSLGFLKNKHDKIVSNFRRRSKLMYMIN